MPGGRPATKPAPKFGQRMAAFRIAKGLSQRELGEKLGMTRDRVVYYEREARNPSLELVEKIAAFFGVSVSEMLNDGAHSRQKPGPPSQFTQLASRLDRAPPSAAKDRREDARRRPAEGRLKIARPTQVREAAALGFGVLRLTQ